MTVRGGIFRNRLRSSSLDFSFLRHRLSVLRETHGSSKFSQDAHLALLCKLTRGQDICEKCRQAITGKHINADISVGRWRSSRPTRRIWRRRFPIHFTALARGTPWEYQALNSAEHIRHKKELREGIRQVKERRTMKKLFQNSLGRLRNSAVPSPYWDKWTSQEMCTGGSAEIDVSSFQLYHVLNFGKGDH